MGRIDRHKTAHDGVIEDALEQVAQLCRGGFEAVVSLRNTSRCTSWAVTSRMDWEPKAAGAPLSSFGVLGAGVCELISEEVDGVGEMGKDKELFGRVSAEG